MKNKRYKIGTVHGRFQPFHLGHLEYFEQAKAQCEHLVIGITNPDPELTAFNSANPKRSEQGNNPFTYWERYLMIQQSLLLKGWDYKDFDIVPFPINFPRKIKYYIPQNAIFFTRVFEGWNYEKIKILENEGYTINILFEGTEKDKLYVGSTIREMIINQSPDWKEQLPEGTVKILQEYNLIQKLTK